METILENLTWAIRPEYFKNFYPVLCKLPNKKIVYQTGIVTHIDGKKTTLTKPVVECAQQLELSDVIYLDKEITDINEIYKQTIKDFEILNEYKTFLFKLLTGDFNIKDFLNSKICNTKLEEFLYKYNFIIEASDYKYKCYSL